MYQSPIANRFQRCFSLALIVLMGQSAASCFAAPTLQSISLRGLQAGGSTTVVITGSDLGKNPKVMIGAPLLKQTTKILAPNRLEASIQVAANAPMGVYQLRVATDEGVSNPLAVSVDALPQMGFSEQTPSLPTSLTGSLTAAQILKTTFTGKKGQRVVAEVESRRLGAALKPVVRILDRRGTQLAFDAGSVDLMGDARCEAVLPADGQYTIVLHDVIYKGANPGHFRLKVGDFQYSKLALPMGVQSGQLAKLQLLGSQAEEFEVSAKGLAPGVIQHTPMPANYGRIGAPPRIMVTNASEILESKTSQEPQVVPAAPVGISGLLENGKKEDRFSIPVKPGMRLRFEVFAQRLGSKLDGVLIVRGEKGNELARNDDQAATTDPRVDVTAPAGAKHLIVAIQDLRGRGGASYVYRIGVSDLAQPDFSLTVDQDRLNIPAGGAVTIRVDAARVAYNGPIQLDLPNLPKGLSISGNRIEAGATFALLTINSSGAKDISAAALTVQGTAVAAKPSFQRVAAAKNKTPQANLQPWLAREVAVASAPAAPLRVSWADDAAELKTHLGGEHDLKLAIDRSPGVKGDVRLKLLATQVIPKKKVKQKNKQVTIDDLDRALRLAPDQIVKDGASSGLAKLLIPADLPDRVWGVVVVAELISPKTKKVVATATTSTRPLRRETPIRLEFQGPAKIEAKAGDGETATLSGSIHRLPGFQKPVIVTLEGLPKGYAPPSATIPAGSSQFQLPIRFAPKAKPAVLKNIRLLGKFLPNPKLKNLVVRTNAATLEVKVVAGDPAKKKEPAKPSPAKTDPAKKDPAKKDAS